MADNRDIHDMGRIHELGGTPEEGPFRSLVTAIRRVFRHKPVQETPVASETALPPQRSSVPHDIMVVHGMGDFSARETLSDFAQSFCEALRSAVPDREVSLVGHYNDSRIDMHCGDEVFRLWGISWERSFKVPGPLKVFQYMWEFSSLYFNTAVLDLRNKPTQGRGPLQRWTGFVLFTMLSLTGIVPLTVILFWLWAARRQVKYQRDHPQDPTPQKVLAWHRVATGLAMVSGVPILMVVHLSGRLARAMSDLPFVGVPAAWMAKAIDNFVVGSLGDAMIYVYDSVQAAFIRGELERVIDKVHALAEEDGGREPQIHIIGHSLGSVIAYEAVSYSLTPKKCKSVKTLCTMGTVLDMIRYLHSSGGLIPLEPDRFGRRIPRGEENSNPRWLNLYARNDPAPSFGPLLLFAAEGPENRPVCSTPKNHSTYWTDVRGVGRPFLACVRDKGQPAPKPPPVSCQSSLANLVGTVLIKLLVAAGVIVVLGAIVAALFPIPPFLTRLQDNLTQLLRDVPGWYPKWLWMLGRLLLPWSLVLLLPSILQFMLRLGVYRWVVDGPKSIFLPGSRTTANLRRWVALKGMHLHHTAALRKQGIWTVRDFLTAVATPSNPQRRGYLSRLLNFLGVPSGGLEWVAEVLDERKEQVLLWASQANLMRAVDGTANARFVLDVGVNSLAALSRWEPADLMNSVRSVQEETLELREFTTDWLAALSQPQPGVLPEQRIRAGDQVARWPEIEAEQVDRWIEKARKLRDLAPITA